MSNIGVKHYGILYGLYVKGKLIAYAETKKELLSYIGKNHISGFIDKFKKEDLQKEMEYGR